MPEIDPVVLEVRLDIEQYRQKMRGATTLVEREFGIQEKRARRLEQEMRRSSDAIGNSFRTLAGTLAAAFTGRELVGLLDSYTRLQNNLKVAGQEGENLARVQQNLLDISQRYGVDIETLSSVFLKASLAQNELGASTEEIIRLNEIVAASLKITGTSAEQARGALLQLGQALGSDIVRGEEFNSLLENALPVVQAAANGIDRFGGSVARLRKEVVDGKVSSQEFFEGILEGGTKTIKDAEAAVLTLAGGYEALSSTLTVYFGEADKANGVSLALGATLQAIADNLDILIPALAIVATSLGVKMVGSAVAGTSAMFALQAAMAGAATTTEALSFAMAGLGRALPFVALTALVGALGYLALNSRRASAEVAALRSEADNTAAEADAMEARLKAAGIETDNLGSAAQTARSDMVDLTGGMEGARQKAAELGAQAVQTAKQLLQMRLQEVLGERQGITDDRNQRQRTIRSQTRTGDALATYGDRTFRSQEDVRLKELDRIEADLRRQIRYYGIGGTAALETPPVPSRPVATAPASGTKKRSGRAERDPIEAARREASARAAYLSELEQLNADELAAKAELTGSIEDRLAAELARIDADTRSFARQVALDEELAAAERDKLVTEQAQVAALRRQEVIQKAKVAELERETRLLGEMAQAEQNVLSSQLALENDREKRARLEQTILDIQHQQERAELDSLLKTLELTGAKQDEIDAVRRRIDLLDQAYQNDSRGIAQTNESPLQRYSRDLNEQNLEDEAEQLIVDEIEHVRRGMRDAISDAIGTDDPLITGLIDLLLQDLILKPLANALQNANTGDGDLLGSLISIGSSIFGGARATGGPVNPRQAFLVGERGPELFVPPSVGNIIPNHRMLAGGMQGGTVKIIVEEAPGFAARVRTEAAGVAVEVVQASAPGIVQASASETIRRANRRTL